MANVLKPAARFRLMQGIKPYSTFTAFLKVICKTNVSIKIRMETCIKFFALTGCGRGGGVVQHINTLQVSIKESFYRALEVIWLLQTSLEIS